MRNPWMRAGSSPGQAKVVQRTQRSGPSKMNSMRAKKRSRRRRSVQVHVAQKNKIKIQIRINE